MKSFNTHKKKLLKDSDFRREYDALASEFALIEDLIEKRLERGLTQAALAKKIGTKQSAIARLESGSYNPSLLFLRKVARALDAKVEVSIS
jgi:predicted transcriptional regulator